MPRLVEIYVFCVSANAYVVSRMVDRTPAPVIIMIASDLRNNSTASSKLLYAVSFSRVRSSLSIALPSIRK